MTDDDKTKADKAKKRALDLESLEFPARDATWRALQWLGERVTFPEARPSSDRFQAMLDALAAEDAGDTPRSVYLDAADAGIAYLSRGTMGYTRDTLRDAFILALKVRLPPAKPADPVDTFEGRSSDNAVERAVNFAKKREAARSSAMTHELDALGYVSGGALKPEPATAAASEPQGINPKDLIGVTKAPVSVLPWPAVFEAASALQEGALKYGRHNWRGADVRASVYFDAALRHLAAWYEGEANAPDSGLPHLAHAIAGLLILRDGESRGQWIDDRPPKSADTWLAEANARARALQDRFPNPVPPVTEKK